MFQFGAATDHVEEACWLQAPHRSMVERSYPTPAARGGSPEERLLPWNRRAQRNHSMFKVRRGGGEDISLVQGKEQRLHFAGAAMTRYPMSKVRETQVR